MPVHQN